MRTISNIARKKESLDVDDGGSTTVVGSTNALTEGSLKGGAWDASPMDDLTRGRLELAFN